MISLSLHSLHFPNLLWFSLNISSAVCLIVFRILYEYLSCVLGWYILLELLCCLLFKEIAYDLNWCLSVPTYISFILDIVVVCCNGWGCKFNFNIWNFHRKLLTKVFFRSLHLQTQCCPLLKPQPDIWIHWWAAPSCI